MNKAFQRFGVTVGGVLLGWVVASLFWYALGALIEGHEFGDAMLGAFWGSVWFGLLIVPILIAISVPASYFTDKRRHVTIRLGFYLVLAVASLYSLALGNVADSQLYDKPIYFILGRVGLFWIAFDLLLVPKILNQMQKTEV